MNFKRNMKGAYKTIKSSFKEYLCFFVALIMVESLFGVIAISFLTNRTVEERIITDAGYTYHATLGGMTPADGNVVVEVYNLAHGREDDYFTYEISSDGSFRIQFLGNLEESRQRFIIEALNRINAGGPARVSLLTTPLFDYDASLGKDIPGFIALLLLLGGLSFLLLMALFRIRINHFKFTYSMYMAFGGDFKKLTQSAFYEILLIALLSFLPALPLTFVISSLIYLVAGQPFFADLFSSFWGYLIVPPIMLILPLVCSLLALLLPMRVLASGIPVKHMKAQDNTNYVSSVRKSKNFFKKSSAYIEATALWRFRSYIAVLLLSTVSFAVLFNVGCYLADVYTVRTGDKITADLSLKLSPNANYDHFTAYFDLLAKDNKIGGYTLEKTAVNPFDGKGDVTMLGLIEDPSILPPHIAIPTDRISSDLYTACPGNAGFSATDALEIRPYDKDTAGCFESVYGYEYEGDPSLLLTDPNSIIVSSHLANKKANSLKPGDIVMLPVDHLLDPGAFLPEDPEEEADTSDFGEINTLAQNLSAFTFTYRAFKVAAVVTNYADYSRTLVYLPTARADGEESAYCAVIGEEPNYSTIRIHLEKEDDKDTVLGIVQSYINNLGTMTVQMDHGSIKERITAAQNNRAMILILSSLVFAVSPLAGFFSQLLFYKKRHLEFDVLRAVGATKKDLRAMFTVDAAVMALLSALTYVIGTYLGIHLLCKLLNTPYIFMFMGETAASTFYPDIPLVPFFIGLILTVLFAVLEVVLCAKQYNKNLSDHIAADFATEDSV
jgi:hypothetical protein